METFPFLTSKSPPLAGFCKLTLGLRAQKLAASGTKSPIVSGGYLKYSRFRETGTGDRVRSALRGRAGKFAAGVSRYLCDSHFGHSQSKMADSLQRTSGKFPFLGDCGRRLGSICTACPSLQCNSPNSPPCPRANGNADPPLPRVSCTQFA